MNRKYLIILTFASLLCFPKANFAQTPDLGTAASFAMFTSFGGFANLGGTTITGDIGTNSGAFTGFPPGTVTGLTQVANTASAQAATDVNTAYAYMNGITCGPVLGITLGGQTLTPNVYCVGAAASLNGDLTLDGQNDPNSLFIIKINGALTTGALSNVILINSASLRNVYWQINGAVILGDNSVFRGTILANGAITLLAGSSLLGRGLSTAGDVSLNNNVITNAGAGLLPVTLVSFSATRQGNSTLLKWSTAPEQNSRNFTIERSNSAQRTSWKAIGAVAAAGISSSTTHYSMMDNNVDKGVNYYRLRSTDINGFYSISGTRAVNFDASSLPIKIFPNPLKSTLTVTGVLPGSTILLMDMAGKLLKKRSASGSGTDILQTSHLSSGAYLLKVVSSDGQAATIVLHRE